MNHLATSPPAKAPAALTASLVTPILAASLALTPNLGTGAATAFCERLPEVRTLSLTTPERRRSLAAAGVVLTPSFGAPLPIQADTELRPTDVTNAADLLDLARAAFTEPELVVDTEARAILTEAWLAGSSSVSLVLGMH